MTDGRRMRAFLLCGLWALFSGAALAQGDQRHEPIQQVAREFIAQQHVGAAGKLRIEVAALDPRLQLSACSSPLEAFLAPGSRSLGNTTVGVRCSGPRPWSVYVPVTVRLHAPVLVAARPLPGGTTIGAGDLEFAERDLAALPGGYLSSLDQAVGKTLKYPVAGGSAMNPAMLTVPRLIRRGDTVTIVAGVPGFEVRANGTALTDGGSGQVIRVRNSLTKKEIEGTVTSSGTVQVRL